MLKYPIHLCVLLIASVILALPTRAAAPATQPASITLQLKNATAKEAIAALQKAAGVPIPLSPPDLVSKGGLPPVTVDLKNASFWSAVREIGLQTGLEPHQTTDDAYPRFELGLGKGTFWKTPQCVAGPLLVTATDISRSSVVELGRTKHDFQRDLTVTLAAYAEPGVKLLWVSPDVKLTLAQDELGHSLMPPADSPSGPEEQELGRQYSESGVLYVSAMSIPLICPENRGKSIARLKGKAAVRIQTASQRVEWEDVMKARNVTKAAGTFPVMLKSLKKADIEYILSISLKREKRSSDDWNNLRQSIFNGQMILVDAKGRIVAARATENGGEYNPNKIDANLRFVREPSVTDPLAEEPFKLIWDAPTASKEVSVEFELKDLPLP